MNKTTFFTILISVFSIFLFSCHTKVTDSNDDGPFEEAVIAAAEARGLTLPLDEEEFGQLPIELQEFEEAYELLDLFYLYAHMKKELGDRNDYFAKARTIPAYRGIPPEYGDIYYMFDQMSCPFTNYFDPSYYEAIADLLYYSDYGIGFGIRLDTIEHAPDANAVIANVYPKGPAKDAGLKEGDIIVSIDRKSVTRSSFEEIETNSKADEVYQFEIIRGEDTISMDLIAAQVQAPTVFVNYRGEIPMITITEFTDTTTMITGTYGEFKEALEQTAGAKATIINLADNGGGSVNLCEAMAAELLPENTILGYAISAEIDSSRNDYKQRIDTTIMMPADFEKEGDGIAKDRYIVFIENGETASCSELLISAVTAARNAPVVGTRSYGKGIGQYYIPTIAGGFAGVTSVQFLDKNMDSYHTFGIEPDVVKPILKDAVDEAFRIAEEATMVRTAGYGDSPTGHFPALARKAGKPQLNRRDHFGAFKVIKSPVHSK